jgi:hypothetical protein
MNVFFRRHFETAKTILSPFGDSAGAPAVTGAYSVPFRGSPRCRNRPPRIVELHTR